MKLGLSNLGLSNTGAGGGAASPYLDGVVASTVFELDATDANSYTSGQKWLNLISSPADGAAQTDYDFYLGVDGSASTDDPTFNGSAGSQAAYWSFDGGDFFQIAGGNTAFLNALHKTTGGEDFWIAVTLQHSDATYANARLFSTLDTGTTPGIYLQEISTEQYRLRQYDTIVANGTSYSPVSLTDPQVLIFSYSHSLGQETAWIQTATGTTNSFSFNTSTSACGLATIGAEPDGGQAFSSEISLFSFAMGNEYLDDTKAAAIISYLETKHGRDYTP